jgi:cytochrome c553
MVLMNRMNQLISIFLCLTTFSCTRHVSTNRMHEDLFIENSLKTKNQNQLIWWNEESALRLSERQDYLNKYTKSHKKFLDYGIYLLPIPYAIYQLLPLITPETWDNAPKLTMGRTLKNQVYPIGVKQRPKFQNASLSCASCHTRQVETGSVTLEILGPRDHKFDVLELKKRIKETILSRHFNSENLLKALDQNKTVSPADRKNIRTHSKKLVKFLEKRVLRLGKSYFFKYGLRHIYPHGQKKNSQVKKLFKFYENLPQYSYPFPVNEKKWIAGKKVFSQSCGNCHRADFENTKLSLKNIWLAAPYIQNRAKTLSHVLSPQFSQHIPKHRFFAKLFANDNKQIPSIEKVQILEYLKTL